MDLWRLEVLPGPSCIEDDVVVHEARDVDAVPVPVHWKRSYGIVSAVLAV